MQTTTEGKLSLIGVNFDRIDLYKDMVVELKKELKMGGTTFRKGSVGLVVKGGKTQVVNFLDENGQMQSFKGDFTGLVLYTDKKFENKNAVVLEHGMKVEMLKSFKVGKHEFKKGAVGIVLKVSPSKQKLMIENTKGWYNEISGDFSQEVKVLSQK